MGIKLAKKEQALVELLRSGHTFRESSLRLKLPEQEIVSTWSKLSDRMLGMTPETLEDYQLVALFERIERQRFEAEVWASEARLNALMDASSEAIFLIEGRSGRIVKFNNRAVQLFGYAPRELVNQTVEMLIEPEARTKHIGLRTGFLSSVRKREMGYHPPIYALTKEGRRIMLDIALTATASTEDVMVVCRVVEEARFTEWSPATGS